MEVVFGAELPLPLAALEGEDPFVLGTTTVTVTLGVVLVTVVPPLLGVVPDFGFVGEVPDVVVPG